MQAMIEFGLMLNVSVMLGRSHRFLGITSTLGGGGGGGGRVVNMSCTHNLGVNMSQGHNTATRMGLEPPTSGSGVRGVNHQDTAPPHPPAFSLDKTYKYSA